MMKSHFDSIEKKDKKNWINIKERHNTEFLQNNASLISITNVCGPSGSSADTLYLLTSSSSGYKVHFYLVILHYVYPFHYVFSWIWSLVWHCLFFSLHILFLRCLFISYRRILFSPFLWCITVASFHSFSFIYVCVCACLNMCVFVRWDIDIRHKRNYASIESRPICFWMNFGSVWIVKHL